MLIIAWEFKVTAGNASQFEIAYGSNGTWAKLFSRSAGYLGTQLLRDTNQTDTYITLDRWQSKEHYEQFRHAFGKDYAQLDKQFESFCQSELLIAEFETAKT